MRISSCLSTALVAATASAATERIYFPDPTGPYHVGKTQQVVEHTTHDDPVAPDGSNHTGSFFLLSVFYPTEQAPTESSKLQYMDANMAKILDAFFLLPDGSLEKIWTPIQWQPPPISGEPSTSDKPTVLFSPGVTGACVTYSVLSTELASQGYTVLCIDHPGETTYLQLPDGSGVEGLPFGQEPEDAVQEAIYAYRVSDAHALVDRLPALAAQLGVPIPAGCAFLGVGHSLGGASVAGIMADQPRVRGGVNLDGAFWGDFGVDLARPFLIMGQPTHNSSVDPTWAAWEAAQSGPWQELSVDGALHVDYTDAPMILQVLDAPPFPASGGIDAFRMRMITRTFVDALFDKALGKGDGVLGEELPNQEWSEVDRIASSEDE